MSLRLSALRVAVCAVAAAAGVLGSGALSRAEDAPGGCSDAYDVYSALASSNGAQVVASGMGLLPVPRADGGAPVSQATIGSLAGSTGFAGAPYSDAGAGNLGIAGVDSNSVPVFALSQYPGHQHEQKQAGTFTIKTDSAAESASASVESSSPGSAPASAGHAETAAAATCAADASFKAVADNTVQAIDIAGVLRIGSVTSHAEASFGRNGAAVLKSSMQVEGATVAGQHVAITDKGIVAAGSTTALPDASPVLSTLASAGITVRYIAAERDPKKGQVLAPGLLITITHGGVPIPNSDGKVDTTMTVGQAFAVVSRSGDAASHSTGGETTGGDSTGGFVAPLVDQPTSSPQRGSTGSAVPPALTGPLTGPPPATAPTVEQAPAPEAATRPHFLRTAFRPWSIERAYSAMAIAVIVLLLSTIGARKVAVRLR